MQKEVREILRIRFKWAVLEYARGIHTGKFYSRGVKKSETCRFWQYFSGGLLSKKGGYVG
jgi:hypothetical protein